MSVKWVVVVAIAAGASVAAAAPRTAQLSYVGDACSAEDLLARVRELVGRNPFVNEAEGALQIAVRVEAGPGATVTIAQGGQRELAASSCSELIDAIAIVIAIDVAGEQPTIEASHSVSPSTAAVFDRGVSIETVAADLQPEAPRTVSLIAGLEGDTHARLSGSVGARVAHRWWSLEGVVALAAPETLPMIDVMGGGVTAAACIHVGPAAACPMASAGWVTGRGHDLVRAYTATTPAARGGMRLAVEHALFGAYAVRARLDGTVSVTSTAFTVDDRIVWASPRGELALGIDVLARIP